VTVPDPDELLPPELLESLEDLEWASGVVARKLGPGVHPSLFAGRGEEFERHRPYQQGDDLRHLDWRLLARTDRLHVRSFRETSNLRTLFLLDASASMDFAGEGGRVTKLRYGALLAAALGCLSRTAGDLPGLLVTGGPQGAPAVALPPRPGRERWRAFLHELQDVGPGASGPLAPSVAFAGEWVPAGSRIVILSDFLEEDGGDELAAQAGHLRARGDEVTAVRILTPEELGESGGGEGLWVDPESPDSEIPGAPARDGGYRARLDSYYLRLARALEDRGVTWREARTTDPLIPLLRGWFRGRGSGLGSGSRSGSGPDSRSDSGSGPVSRSGPGSGSESGSGSRSRSGGPGSGGS
jgi:uncharacterized protein (DUF58 family)